MSIKSRIEEAEILWNEGRMEGAWVQVLVATAATARKRYPRPMSDNKAFKSFIRDVTPTILYGTSARQPFRAQLRFGAEPFEDIFYEKIRCYLVHEGELSDEIVFSQSTESEGQLTAILRVGPPHEIPDFWALHLAKAVREAPENQDLFGTV